MRRRRQRPCGFTLIEMLVVMTLIGLLAAIVSVSLVGPYRRAQQTEVLSRIQAIEHRLRHHAREFGRPQLLRFRFEPTSLEYGPLDDETVTLRRYVFPSGWRFESIAIAGTEHRFGEADVYLSDRGQSPTYGLRLIGPDDARHIYVVLGMTGEWLPWEDERAWETLLVESAPRGLAN